MNSGSRSSSPVISKSIVALYQVSDPDTAKRLCRERAGWLDSADIERLDVGHAVLVIRSGGALGARQ